MAVLTIRICSGPLKGRCCCNPGYRDTGLTGRMIPIQKLIYIEIKYKIWNKNKKRQKDWLRWLTSVILKEEPSVLLFAASVLTWAKNLLLTQHGVGSAFTAPMKKTAIITREHLVIPTGCISYLCYIKLW